MIITKKDNEKFEVGDYPRGNKSWRIVEVFEEYGEVRARCERIPMWSDKSRSANNFR